MRFGAGHKRATLTVVAALLAGLLGAACTGSATGHGGHALGGAQPCAGSPGFTCSFLTVPVNWTGGEPGTLRLQVAVAGNASAPRGTLVFLTGGPGQPGVPFVAEVRSKLPGVVRSYRLVMIDQRGTGDGSLSCPALQYQMGESDTFP